jgi:hypothetical protein
MWSCTAHGALELHWCAGVRVSKLFDPKAGHAHVLHLSNGVGSLQVVEVRQRRVSSVVCMLPRLS